MGIVGDQGHGKIGEDEGLRQRRERQDHEERLGQRRDAAEMHQPRILARRADQRDRRLHDRDGEGEDQSIVAKLDDHRTAGLQARS